MRVQGIDHRISQIWLNVLIHSPIATVINFGNFPQYIHWLYMICTEVIISRLWRHRLSSMTSSLVVDDVITCQGHPSMNTPHPKNCRKIVRTTEFRVKNVVNNNCQLYHGLLTYYSKSSFLNLSHFPNYTFLHIEWAIVDISAPKSCKATKKIWTEVPIIIYQCEHRSQNLAVMVLMTYPLRHCHCWHCLKICNYI